MSRPIDAFTKHVDLLRPLLEAKTPQDVMSAGSSAEERQLLLEMKNAGFIDCIYRSDEMGRPSDFGNIVITIPGRALVAEFDKREEQKSTWHESWWGVLILGILGSLIVAFIVWKLGWI